MQIDLLKSRFNFDNFSAAFFISPSGTVKKKTLTSAEMFFIEFEQCGILNFSESTRADESFLLITIWISYFDFISAETIE